LIAIAEKLRQRLELMDYKIEVNEFGELCRGPVTIFLMGQ
jgi:hypothetical protein